MNSDRQQIAELEEQLRNLEAVRNLIGDALTDQKKAELEASLQALLNTGGGAAIGGGVNAGRDFTGRDKITVNIQYGAWQGKPPRTDDEALAIYRGVLAQRCGDIPLTGLDRDADDAGSRYRPLGLERVYVALDTAAQASAKAIETALATGQPLASDRLGGERAKDRRPLSALEAAVIHRRLALLGGPGSGKTTFVNRLCLALARNEWGDLEGWPERERHRLPVLVILRDFARWVSGHSPPPEPCAALLWAFIRHDLDKRNLGFASGLLQTALEQGRAQVFLDGLDEVSPETRPTVLGTIEQFAQTYHQTAVLVTCRVASYEQAAWRLPDDRFPEFPALTLAPFDQDKIQRFVGAWYDQMAQRWNEPLERTRELAARLNEALRRPDLARLAPNPLLLTVMALVHTHDKVLPDHRAVLYDRCVDILLWRWEGRKEQGAEPELLARLRQAGVTETDLLRELRRLAYEAHGQSGDSEDPEQVAGINEMTLVKALSGLHPQRSLDWAKALADLVRQRTGLLVEREPDVFAFPHRTFQEYLAGVHLALQPNFITNAEKLAESGAFWREVILLAVGYKVHSVGDYDLALALVNALCPSDPPVTAAAWRKIRLAGDALLEMGVERAKRQPQGPELVPRVRGRLTELVEQGRLDPVERAQAGEVLGALDDPRFDPERFYLPCRYRGEPEAKLGFVEIPEGAFWMGSERGDSEAYRNEFGNSNPLEIPYPYWIARYPVTVAQFGVFVNENCYSEKEGWRTKAAQRWLQQGQASEPRDWDAQRLHPNRPVMNVTWYEAIAYCAWLEGALRHLGEFPFPGGYTVRLPTEAEWEKAACGGDRVRYPWGDADWDVQRANIDGSNIDHPTPVGVFPLGATPSGLHDLAGNVWEWTLTVWGDYPYKPARNNAEERAARVVRGGSWIDSTRRARCASRVRLTPDLWSYNQGFRVVLSLANSEF